MSRTPRNLLPMRRPAARGPVTDPRRVLDALLEHSVEAVIVKDLDGIVTHWNGQAAALYGFSPEEAVGRSIRSLHAADLTEAEYRETLERLRAGIESSQQVERRRKSGEFVTVELRRKPLRDEGGKPVGEITFVRDLTELRRTEESLRTAQTALEARLAELEGVNTSLQREVDDRRSVEEALSRTNTELQETVNNLKWYSHESETFSEMAEVLQACLVFDEAFAAVSEFGQKLMPDAAGHFFVYRSSRDVLEHAASWGEDPPAERTMTPEHCWALRRGQVHSAGHRSRLRCTHVNKDTMGSFCVPIIGQGQTLGLLHVAAYHEEWESPTHGELVLRRLKTMADRVGPALANLKLRETLRGLSIQDPLTGLYNRRYLEESFKRELHRAQRNKSTVGLIAIDVDHFKRFNDTFGHDAGDLVLKSLAQRIKAQIRKSDLPCRLGGEELAVLLPEAPLEIVVARAEQMRAAVRSLSLKHEGQTLGTVTASFGVAVYPAHGSTVETLLQAADKALYRAKHAGRDRVVVAED